MEESKLKMKAIRNYLDRKNYNPEDNSYIESLTVLIDNAIKYVSKNTGFTEEELYEILNQNIDRIELVYGFSDEDPDIIKEDNKNGVLKLHIEKISKVKDGDELNSSVTTEIIRALSRRMTKQLIFKTMLMGYEETSKKSEENEGHKRNITFNNAVIEYFTNKEKENQKRSFMGLKIRGNLESPSYCVIINLIKQMMVAKGISDEELFDGLFSKDARDKVIGLFDEDTFKNISKTMDALFNDCTEYCFVDNATWEEENEKNKAKSLAYISYGPEIQKNIRIIEKLIIDKILVPQLIGKTREERKNILDSYQEFIMSERDYFNERTEYDLSDVLTGKTTTGGHITISGLGDSIVRTHEKNSHPNSAGHGDRDIV